MTVTVSTSKRLAKNTLFMYVRMIVVMFISFYTSRVVLQQLGVEDFGIYDVVGSVVAMFNSLRVLFSSSTQRFLNFEMGNGGSKLGIIFNTSIRINIIVSVIFFVLVECVGIWFFNNKINIDGNRYFAAMIVFQLSVLTAIIQIFLTSYDAVIISHEKMQFYAYMSLMEAVLKLLVVYILSVSLFDKLVLYSILLLVISFIVLTINVLYCYHNFEETKLSKLHDTSYFLPMFNFAGWNFMGNTAYAMSQSLQSMILNVFAGPILNTARGLASQVSNALSQVTNNINIVVSPYCIKSHASGEDNRMFDMIFLSSKILFTVQLCISIMFIYLSDFLLNFWLGQIPDYSVVFLQFVMVYSLVRSIHGPLDTLFKSFGNLKYYQLCEGIFLSLPILMTIVAFKLGAPFYFLYVNVIVCEILNYCVIIPLSSRIAKFPVSVYIRRVICPCLLTIVVPVILFFVRLKSFLSLLLLASIACLCALVVMWAFGFSKLEKLQVKSVIKK